MKRYTDRYLSLGVVLAGSALMISCDEPEPEPEPLPEDLDNTTFRTALIETVQHLTDCQAMLDDTLELADCCPDIHTGERKAHMAKWRNITAPGSNHPLV